MYDIAVVARFLRTCSPSNQSALDAAILNKHKKQCRIRCIVLEGDEIKAEIARWEIEVDKIKMEVAAKKATEKAKRVAEVAIEKTAKEKRIKVRERVKEKERREGEERESRRKKNSVGVWVLFYEEGDWFRV